MLSTDRIEEVIKNCQALINKKVIPVRKVKWLMP